MAILEVKDVAKDYKNGNETLHALKKTSFQVNSGEFVAIIGPSGSGKSTLLSIIGGLLSPSNGEVILNGKNFKDLKKKEMTALRFEEIGFILQASNLVPYLKVKEQLQLRDKYSRQKTNDANVKELLDLLEINKLAKKFPEMLSGGERQRVAIANAIYGNPSIILADEPTASLDSKKAFLVVELLAKIGKAKNKAIIMVTHDERLLQFCDRVLKIEDGVLEEISAK